ncbi:MAG: type I-D CRISPR-associated protein Cas7/Csc2 [Desulfurococcaceae archaeon]
MSTPQLKPMYVNSVGKLKEVLGEDIYKSIEPYLHTYTGKVESVKPVAKHITIYWIGRAEDRMILRTEGEDDIILSEVKEILVPTIIFRKLKAVYLREFMQLLRRQWELYDKEIREAMGDSNYDFLASCSLSPGIAKGKDDNKGTQIGRCMKCPADVLMGATSGLTEYNLVSRFVGDSAYALTGNYRARTGTAVDEVTYTTYTYTKERKQQDESKTGAVFTENHVEPGTLFVGKTVLFMPSPVELLYVLWLLTRTVRIGARTSIWGTMKVDPVALVADLYEVGSSYEASEELLNKTDEEEARKGLLNYVKKVAYATGTNVVEVSSNMINKLRSVNVVDKDLVKELWLNARNYISAVNEYIVLKKKLERSISS